jgi:hypothetical protein
VIKLSGFGALASLAFAVFILIQSYSFLVLVSENLFQTFAELPSTMMQPNSYELYLTRVEENIVYFKLVNNGPRDISVRNLLTSDLFIIYTDVQGFKRTVLVQYNPVNRNQNNIWYLKSVTYREFPNELVDPVDLSTGLEGIWNVGETLNCIAVLETGVNSSLPIYAKFRVVG